MDVIENSQNNHYDDNQGLYLQAYARLLIDSNYNFMGPVFQIGPVRINQ